MAKKVVNIQYVPYPEELDQTKPLEAGKFLFPGFGRLLEPAYSEVGDDKVKYITGLDPELYEGDEKEEIIKVIDKLEKHFGKDALNPFNAGFWKKRVLNIEKKNIFLDLDNPDHLLTYYHIKGGGFKEVAPNYGLVHDGAEQIRWVMISPEDMAEVDLEDDMPKDMAIAALIDLYNKRSPEDLFLVHKALVSSDRGISRSTPKATVYKDLSMFIKGELVHNNKKLTPKQFLEIVELLKTDKKKLHLIAYVKEGVYFNFLSTSEDNQLKNVQTGTKYGTTNEKAVAYLNNPGNQNELDNLKERVESKWKE